MFRKSNLGFIFFFVFFGFFIVQAEPALHKKPMHNWMLFGQIMHHESFYLDQSRQEAASDYEQDVLFKIAAPFILTHLGAGYSFMYPVYSNFQIGVDIGFGLNIIKIMLREPAFIFPLNLKAFIGTERFGVQFNGGISAYSELDLLIPYDIRLFHKDQVGWNSAFFGQIGSAIKFSNLGLGVEYHFAFDESKSVHGETAFVVFKASIVVPPAISPS